MGNDSPVGNASDAIAALNSEHGVNMGMKKVGKESINYVVDYTVDSHRKIERP